jgi:hypothetical protein
VTLLERRIRRSAILIVFGVATLLATLLWRHPLSFMAFLGIGSPLILVGILLYLHALASSKAIDES